MSFLSSNYNNIEHPIDRSLLGTCAVTLLFLLVSLTLFGPFIALLVPSLIAASICRLIIKLLFCDSCQYGPEVRNHEYYSPDRLLTAEETRWLKTTSNIIVLLIVNGVIDIDALRSVLTTRLLKLKGDEVTLSADSVPSQPTRPIPVHDDDVNSNKLLYPKFSQRICKTKSGWKWRFDEKFNIENHVHNWKGNVPISIVSNGQKLSELISQINSLQLDLEHPPWDSYLIPTTDNVGKKESNFKANHKHDQNNKSDPSLLIFRLHPSLSDGISLVHVLCSSLSDEQCQIDLKDRFHSTGKCLNTIRALFIGPVVFIQKWLLTRRDHNIFHPFSSAKPRSKTLSNNSSTPGSLNAFGVRESNDVIAKPDQDHLSVNSPINSSVGDQAYHYASYSLATVCRIKGVTRSTVTEIFLAAVAGALRTYQQHVCKLSHPYDVLCLLPADLTKEHHSSTPRRNSSSMASKTSNQSSMSDVNTHITNNYSLLDFGLPTNTEGMIPRLWEVKQRMEELKNSADSMILCGLLRILKHLCPDSVGRRLMKTYYDKNSLSISSLQGPDCTLSICGQSIENIVYWFPSLCDITLSISCFSYGDSFTCSVLGDSSNLPKIELILDAVVYQLDLLNKLLEYRRIPGEHKSQRYPTVAGDEPKLPLSIGKFDSNEREMINKSLSPSVSSDHLYRRLSSIQNQLQNDKDLNDEDLDSLRSEFSNLMGILRRRKSCGIDTNGELADFDEEIQEMSDAQINSRRPSIPGLLALSSRRRSLATSLARPLNTGYRSRSNSKTTIQSTNYLVSPSCSSSTRASLRIPDDIESGLAPDHAGLRIDNNLTNRATTALDSSVTPGAVRTPSAENSASRQCLEDRV